MENLAPSSGLSPLLRPVTALQGDLAAALREGRVLAGEVLEKLDGGTYVLSVAGQRVPAESRVELEVGSSQRFEVVREGKELLLRLLPPATSTTEPPLLSALRALSGAELPAEDALARLERVLARQTASGNARDAWAPRLLAALASRVHDPQAGAEALRARLAGLVPGGAAALLAAFAELGLDDPARAIASFADRLAHVHERALPSSGGALLAELEDALSRALGRIAPRELGATALGGAELRALANALHAELVRVLRARGEIGTASRIADVLEAGGARLLLEEGELPLLRALYHGGSSKSLRALALAGAERDLEGLLAAALPDLGSGETADAARGALRSLELERLLQLARHAAGEPSYACFPLPSAGAGARVQLLVSHEHNHGGGEREKDDSWRTSLRVELPSLGPVRAEVLVRSGSLSIRLCGEREETVERMRAQLGALESSLAELRPEVSIGVVRSRETADDRGSPAARDVRFLREHSLLDLRG